MQYDREICNVYFTRLSEDGKKLAEDLNAINANSGCWAEPPEIFWSDDRYSLFFIAEQQWFYTELDKDGKEISERIPLNLSIPETNGYMLKAIQAGGKFYILHTAGMEGLNSRLDLSVFDPIGKIMERSATIAWKCQEEYSKACDLDSDWGAGKPELFATDSEIAIAWHNLKGDVLISFLPMDPSKPRRSIKAARFFERNCQPGYPESRAYMLDYRSCKCSWNGSEIAIWTPVNIGGYPYWAFKRVRPDGRQVGKEKYFRIPVPQEVEWTSSSLYQAGRNHIIFFNIQKIMLTITP